METLYILTPLSVSLSLSLSLLNKSLCSSRPATSYDMTQRRLNVLFVTNVRLSFTVSDLGRHCAEVEPVAVPPSLS